MSAPRKWELLKRHAAQDLGHVILCRNTGVPHVGDMLMAVMDVQMTRKVTTHKAVDLIIDAVCARALAWDVRGAATLITLAPGCVPGNWFRSADRSERDAYAAVAAGTAGPEERTVAKTVACLGGYSDASKLGVLRKLSCWMADNARHDWMVAPL